MIGFHGVGYLGGAGSKIWEIIRGRPSGPEPVNIDVIPEYPGGGGGGGAGGGARGGGGGRRVPGRSDLRSILPGDR